MKSEIIAYSRIFADELKKSDYLVSHLQNQIAIITITGAVVSKILCTGAITEILNADRGKIAIRLADPTGVFSIFLNSRNKELIPDLQNLILPAFAMITASVEEDSRHNERKFRLIADSVTLCDRNMRDQWIINTAELTLHRLEHLNHVMSEQDTDDSVKQSITHYKTGKKELKKIAEMVEKALLFVKTPPKTPEDLRDYILNLIKELSGPRGVSVQELSRVAGSSGICDSALMDITRILIGEDEIYQPSSGFVKIL